MPFYQAVQLRRYGGDLQGVIDELDYLQELGVTALFLNPINDSPSLHKYDARNYRHIDRNFGPDPRRRRSRDGGRGTRPIPRRGAGRPPTACSWPWWTRCTDAACGSSSTTRGTTPARSSGPGRTCWRTRRQSPYADWYEIERFDDTATPDTNEFSYSGWAGVPNLPEWRKIGRPEGARSGAVDGTLVPGVRELVFNVTRRWLDPNGDGDPSDGVDGFRLDVAEIVPLDFWREYRQVVRDINPEAYLVGEVWWEKWPEKMFDTAPWLQGDVFDAVMNYRWYEPTRRFFAGAPPALNASGYVAALDSIAAGIPAEHLRGHDEPDGQSRLRRGSAHRSTTRAATSTGSIRARTRTTGSTGRTRARARSRR